MMAAGAQEDGGVVKTGYEPAQPSKDRENRDDRGKHFLEAGQRKRLTNLDSLAVPEQLIAFVEAQPLKILDAQRRDVGRPIGLCTLSHGCVPLGLVFPVKPLLKLQNPPTEVLDDLGQLSQRLLHRLDHLDRRDDFAYRRTRHVRRSVEADAQPERRAPPSVRSSVSIAAALRPSVVADERGGLAAVRFGPAFATALFGAAAILIDVVRAALLAGSA
jgi:hypothetical protein